MARMARKPAEPVPKRTKFLSSESQVARARDPWCRAIRVGRKLRGLAQAPEVVGIAEVQGHAQMNGFVPGFLGEEGDLHSADRIGRIQTGFDRREECDIECLASMPSTGGQRNHRPGFADAGNRRTGVRSALLVGMKKPTVGFWL